VALLIETSLASGRDILRGIGRYNREVAPWALYHEAHGLEDAAPRWLRRWRGDGIIARIQTPAMAEAIAATKLPAIDTLGVVPGLPFPIVHVSNQAIAAIAAQHFIERGLRQFAFVGIENENWSEERYAAYCQAVAHVESQVPIYVQPRDPTGVRSWERSENRLAAWVAALPKPVGVMVCSDQRGPQLLEACRRAGVAVPDEVAAIGVDNDEALCDVCNPPLSSVEPGHRSVGYKAAALLDRLLQGAAIPGSPLLVEPDGVVPRLSTDALFVDDEALRGALRLIRERAAAGVSVNAVARHVGLSRSVLQRRFRCVLGRSVHQEILNVRLKRARELLIKTELPLAVIAERAGFRHQEYMGAVFRARVGRTPGQVRAGATRRHQAS
jgi:LacI family transcriptional regulator